MGEVYRARDERLGREVAVKVLTGETVDPDRLRRFEHEARAAGALNHPNLVTVFDTGRQAGRPFVVFELLDGATLRQRLGPGALTMDKALDYAVQIARGLAAAHEKGIVHRDLKPENLFVTRDEQVKILDFGLAKLRPSLDGTTGRVEGSTATDGTAHGIILGTTGYMSPEQVRGEPADARSDIFSFGAVLYEMLGGGRAFRAPTAAETMTAILRDDPAALAGAGSDVPVALDRLVRRCLEKGPQQRFQSARDVAFALEAIAGSWRRGRWPLGPPPRLRREWLRFAAAAVVASVLGIGVTMGTRWPRAFDHPPPKVVPLTAMGGVEVHPTFSPDGDQVAFDWDGERSDNWDIYVTMVGSPESRRLTTDAAPDTAPSWSPDGRQIAFACGRPESTAAYPEGFMTVCLVSPLGGPVRRLSDFPARAGSPPSWSPDGRWLAVDRAPSQAEPGLQDVYLLPVQGGEPHRLGLPPAAKSVCCPAFSPDGRHLAFASQHSVVTFSVDVVELAAGHVPSGPPRRLTSRTVFLVGSPAWTRDGKSLIYADSRLRPPLRRVGVDGKRPPERIDIAGREALMPATALSRDRLAFVRDSATTQIYRFEAGRPGEPVLASSFTRDYNPDFSPDGRRFAFESDRSGEGIEIWLADVDGGNPIQLTRGPGLSQGTPRWSPDGRRIAFDSLTADGRWDIWTVGVDGSSPRRLTWDPGDEHGPCWSRDGRFVYFTANRTASAQNGPEVWRVPSTGGPAERLTRDGGWHVQVSLDDRTVFFHRDLASGPLIALPTGGGPPRRLLECTASFTVGPAGIYYVGCSSGPPRFGAVTPARPPGGALFLLDVTTGQPRVIRRLEWATDWWGPTVSPDGSVILLTRWLGEGADLMLIDDFR
jgi:Tol biopolymer transport system component